MSRTGTSRCPDPVGHNAERGPQCVVVRDASALRRGARPPDPAAFRSENPRIRWSATLPLPAIPSGEAARQGTRKRSGGLQIGDAVHLQPKRGTGKYPAGDVPPCERTIPLRNAAQRERPTHLIGGRTLRVRGRREHETIRQQRPEHVSRFSDLLLQQAAPIRQILAESPLRRFRSRGARPICASSARISARSRSRSRSRVCIAPSNVASVPPSATAAARRSSSASVRVSSHARAARRSSGRSAPQRRARGARPGRAPMAAARLTRSRTGSRTRSPRVSARARCPACRPG